jgi:hypothetical protein
VRPWRRDHAHELLRGQDEIVGAQLRITVDAPEPFLLAIQVAAWSDATAMSFELDGDGDLVGHWPLETPLPVPFDDLTTWFLNVAEGAPVGIYSVTIELVAGSVLGADTFDYIVAAAESHGGGGGGGGGDDGGGDGGLPPVASITSGPGVISGDDSAVFEFDADQLDVDFACSLDGAVAALCSSPVTIDGLDDGAHTFALYATGGISLVGPTTVRSWSVDTEDPTIDITSAPAALTTSTSATFEYVAEGAVTVLCGIDGAVLEHCADPTTVTDLTLGTHVFTIVAVDAAGNHASDAHWWTVVPESESYPPLVPMTPARLADTRVGWSATDGRFVASGPVAAGSSVEVPVADRFGVPVDAEAVVVNVTVTNAVSRGYAQVFACGTVPVTSSLNFGPLMPVANEVIVPLSPDGSVCVRTTATADVIVDVVGYR